MLFPLGGVVLAAAGAFALAASRMGAVQVDRAALEFGQAKYAVFEDYLPLRGDVVPRDSVFVTAEAGGRIDEIIAADGATVAKGNVLAKLYNADALLQIRSREADISGRLIDLNNQALNLKKAQDQGRELLADATYQRLKAERDYLRRRSLKDGGFINEAVIKPYVDELTYQNARVAALEGSQRSDMGFYDAQRRQLQKMGADLTQSLTEVRRGREALVLVAPMAGRLTNFNPNLGQTVQPGEAIGQVDSEAAFKVKAQVDEFYLQRLRPGLSATARIHERMTALTVSKVFSQIANGRVNIELTFVGAAPTTMKRGEAVDVRLSLGDPKTALLVPNGSWLTDTGGVSAFVEAPDGRKARRRAIQVGRRNPESVEILAGLKAGERIITSGAPERADIEKLRITRGERAD